MQPARQWPTRADHPRRATIDLRDRHTGSSVMTALGIDVACWRTMLMIILIVVLVLALAGGGAGHSRFGLAGWSPAGLIVLVLVVLWLTGHL